jgi:hypothetical protein
MSIPRKRYQKKGEKQLSEKNVPLLSNILRERYFVCFPAIAPLFQGMFNLNTESQLRLTKTEVDIPQ